MTRSEFAEIMNYIALAIDKSLPAASQEVYFDLLGDLPAENLRRAARQVIVEHPWHTFPSVNELRKAATAADHIHAASAWELAWNAIKGIDLEQEHTLKRLANLPPLVKRAMIGFGLPSMIHGKEPVAVLRQRFMDFFEKIQASELRDKLLPESAKPTALMAPALKRLTEKIGKET